MALFILKPVFWNSNAYVKPSGAKVKSGFPKENGYGHEEWNNSPRMQYEINGRNFRVFHTEGVKNAPVIENAGQTFVFMTASHDRIQQLVGIAGNACCMIGDVVEDKLRLNILNELGLNDLWEDAWELESVKECYGYSKQKFLKAWKNDMAWIPNWICPDEFFWWFDEPVTLDSNKITGKKILPKMFAAHQIIDLHEVGQIMAAIPSSQRNEKWQNLSDAIACAPSEPSKINIDESANIESITTALATVQARRGQGKFRTDLMKIWAGACAVTGLTNGEVLRASHVKPWKDSTAKQRLDPNNGLILTANLDALFDKGLITFDSDGSMLVSKKLGQDDRARLGVPGKLRTPPSAALSDYLKLHFEIFQKDSGAQ